MRQFLFPILFALTASTNPPCDPDCSCQLDGFSVIRMYQCKAISPKYGKVITYGCPFAGCTCQTDGNGTAHWYKPGPISNELRHNFEKMIRGFYPGIYEDTPASEIIRHSRPFNCRNGHPSKTRVVDILADMQSFVSIDHNRYQIPQALKPNAQSAHFLRSIPTMLQMSRIVPRSMWIDPKYELNEVPFAKTAFYQWAKNIPIFADAIIREWYLRPTIRVDRIPETGFMEFIAPTIGSEFSPSTLAALSACKRDYSESLPFKYYQVRKLQKFGLIAIHTASRDKRVQPLSLTDEMMTEFVAFLNWLGPTIKPTPRTPIIEYSRDHPAAVAFQKVLPTTLNELNAARGLPLIDWDNFLITQEQIDLIAAACEPPRVFINQSIPYRINADIFRIMLSRLVQLSSSGRSGEAGEAASLLSLLPRMLLSIHNTDLLTAFVGLTTKVDLARLAFDAFTEGPDKKSFPRERTERPSDEEVPSDLYLAFYEAKYHWIFAAFGDVAV